MCGSSASNGYARSGTEYAIGFSFVRFGRPKDMLPPVPSRCTEEPDADVRGDLAAPAGPETAAAVGHLPRLRRGAPPPLPGLRREAKRDPRGARGRRPGEGEPGVL